MEHKITDINIETFHVKKCPKFYICRKLTKTNRDFSSVEVPQHVSPYTDARPPREIRPR